MKDVAIIGGGLAGLINSIQLTRAGLSVVLFERKEYPFHRVCGEYISNEVVPFLESIDCMPKNPEPARINQFILTSVKGRSLEMPLDLGGFGISRYRLDHYLANKAKESGVELITGETVEHIHFDRESDSLELKTRSAGKFSGKVVIGSFGKRSKIDAELDRDFFKKRSPYIGVKYHIKTDFDPNTIALHNFKGGYCGISKVEGDTYNLCYLGSRKQLRRFGSISEMEEATLMENPYLRNIFKNSDFLFEKPVVINEFSFEKKEPVFNHILMSGDSAGLITPLCGNGMALAIHSAKICSELVIEYFKTKSRDRSQLETMYTKKWNSLFSQRLWAGRQIQKLFGTVNVSEFAVTAGNLYKPFPRYLMRKTHGEPF